MSHMKSFKYFVLLSQNDWEKRDNSKVLKILSVTGPQDNRQLRLQLIGVIC